MGGTVQATSSTSVVATGNSGNINAISSAIDGYVSRVFEAAGHNVPPAIRGEESRWVREDGVTTYTRQNTKLALALLDRVSPAESLPEVLAVATQFDWYLQLIDDGVSAADLWDLFFDEAIPRCEHEARARVRASLHLCEESADFDDECDDDEGDIEYKSMAGPRGSRTDRSHAKTPRREVGMSVTQRPKGPKNPKRKSGASRLCGFA